MSNEELMIFLRKNVISVTCVALSIAILVALYMRSDLLPEAEKVLTEKAKKAELLQANIEDSNQLDEQHAAITASNEAISARMIRVGQLAENLQYFYRLESDTGAKLTDIRQNPWNPPGKNAPKTNFTPVSFTLAAQGDYTQVLDMLRRLENGDHYCRIMTCNVHPQAEMRGGQLSLGITLELLATP